VRTSRRSLSSRTVLLIILASNVSAQTGPQAVSTALGGTSWQLVKFQGSDDKTLAPDDRAKYTIAFEGDGSVSVRIDCNRGRGTWKSEGPNQLRFGPLALTRAMCPPAPLNDRVAKDWPYVRSYVLRNGHLFLSLVADRGSYEFEPLSAQGTTTAEVWGTASYRERIALPPHAVFEATLEDVSKADAAPEVIGQAHIENPANPPIRFEIAYNPSLVNPSHRYAVRARIVVDGKLFFTTDQNYPVLGAGQNSEVSLLLRRAAVSTAGRSAETPAPSGLHSRPSLENTYWKLTRVGGTDVPVASTLREPYFALNSESHRVSGSGGCNGLTGSYELNGQNLTFRQMASTMMACPEGMDTEKAFLQALTKVRKWKIAEQRLQLLDASDNEVASLEVRYTK